MMGSNLIPVHLFLVPFLLQIRLVGQCNEQVRGLHGELVFWFLVRADIFQALQTLEPTHSPVQMA